jgi:type II secretory pathway pseudopilin PulG
LTWDFKRRPAGFTLPELLVRTVIAATLTGALVSAVTYWNQSKSKSINGVQVPMIENALRQYLRTYGNLPNLSTSKADQNNQGEENEANSQWLRLYPSASGQPMPQGITYSIQRQYVPSTLSKGQVPGEVRLTGTGCSPIDPATSCTLSLTP